MPICSNPECKNERRPKQRYCREHHAEWMRENRKPYSEFNDLDKKKAACRRRSNYLREIGVLIPEPCQCGCEHVEMHHPDYTKPLEIIWLCRDCHLELHRKERELAKEQEDRTLSVSA